MLPRKIIGPSRPQSQYQLPFLQHQTRTFSARAVLVSAGCLVASSRLSWRFPFIIVQLAFVLHFLSSSLPSSFPSCPSLLCLCHPLFLLFCLHCSFFSHPLLSPAASPTLQYENQSCECIHGFRYAFISQFKLCPFQRCPLGSTILKVKLLDMGEPRALLATALSPPSLSDIERTVLLLKEVGLSCDFCDQLKSHTGIFEAVCCQHSAVARKSAYVD